MTAKDRVTIVCCANVTGTCKIDPLIVGKSAKPRCFRDISPPLPYVSQHSSWLDRTVYAHWWTKIFLPSIRKFTTEPVALLMDNCSGHDLSQVDPLGHVKVAIQNLI